MMVAQSVSRLGYGLDDSGSILGRGNDGICSLRHRFQTCTGTHSSSYPMGTRGSYPGSKAAGAWSWPLNFI